MFFERKFEMILEANKDFIESVSFERQSNNVNFD
jgi:hypothetical protein